MPEDHDSEITRLAATSKCGSVVAAAGCGKTEQISRATLIADGRRLILTHTHAGVDVLRARLKKHGVPRDKYRVDTIAGWALRYAASFPKRSMIQGTEPKTEEEWNGIYKAGAALIGSGAVNRVLAASYSGVFVDEYQDCSKLQHDVIKALVSRLPVCIFGDPLQAIFDFKNQKPVGWDSDVFPTFTKLGELKVPYRWKIAGNDELANWLVGVRDALSGNGKLDLSTRPACVKWQQLPSDAKYQQGSIVGVCKSLLGQCANDGLVIMADPANINGRAAIAQKLATAGFSNIEPLGCVSLYDAARAIERASGFGRLEAAMDFISACMVGTERKPFLDGVKSHQQGGKQGGKTFGNLIQSGLAIAGGTAYAPILALVEGFYQRPDTRLFRDEMFYTMRSALRMLCGGQATDLLDAIWDVQNGLRHAGRVLRKRSIGSVLLVKGLEFDHSIIVHSKNMTRKDWYVALTRATKSVTVVSPALQIASA